ncbi:MAG: ABC transporter permease [Acidobacteriota bacterium]
MRFASRLLTPFQQAAGALWRHKLRSFLTMFGIGWGICCLALIASTGEGFREGQRKNWAQLGDGIVMVFPGRTEMQTGGRRAGRNIHLFQRDVEAIKQLCPLVQVAAGEIKNWSVPVESSHNAGQFLVLGVDPDYLRIRNLPASSGRDINWSDVENRSRVCVLGDSVRKQLFPRNSDALGAKVRIRGYQYDVVGLMSEKNQNSSYDGWDNDKVLIPNTTLRADCPLSRPIAVEGRVQDIVYRPRSLDQWEETQVQVRGALARIHGFDPSDEAAVPMWDTIETAAMFDDIFSSLRFFLGAVGLITLSLGGMGVMNTMMTSVLERTAEIGLKKALGATKKRVLFEILTEGILLSAVSGVIGLLLVAGLAVVVNSLPLPAFFSGLPINEELILNLVGFLGAVAVLSALPPAWRAARMTPIEALRFEQ